MSAREPYDYDRVSADEILRPLDPTEHNMERLNRIGGGAGVVYQTARVRGSLSRAAFEAAVVNLMRHAALRSRIVRGADGLLAFAPSACDPEVHWIEVDDPARTWPRYVEADMNAGPVATHRGSGFRAFVLSGRGEHAIILTAPHHVFDGIGSVALMLELLEQLAEPRPLPLRPMRSVDSQFVAPSSIEHRARLQALEGDVTAWTVAEPLARRDRQAQLLAALEALETELLAAEDVHALPALLLDLQRLLVTVERWHPHSQPVLPDVDGGDPTEAGACGLYTAVVASAVMTPLFAAARVRGISMHGVFGAALSFAHAARHWALSGAPDGAQAFPIGNPVNLRRQFHSPLAADDVRMSVDVAIAVVPIEPSDRFWEVAARYGSSVRKDLHRRRALGSWFRTERRSIELPLSGGSIPLLSNVGRIAAAPSYGGLDLLELYTCLSARHMFPMAMVTQTLGDAAHISYYHDLPTVSRGSIRRISETVHDVLHRVAAGENPPIGERLGVWR